MLKSVLIFCLFAALSRAQEKPNVIFILADDLGWNDVGFHGSDIPTPNIDELAYNGVILDNYYIQSSCTPSRAAFLTGKYPIHTGLHETVIKGSEPWGLPLNETTIAQILQQNGYATHAIGKWHLGFFEEGYIPSRRGFDSFYGFYNKRVDYWSHMFHENGLFGLDFWSEEAGKTPEPLFQEFGKYMPGLCTDKAVEIIKNQKQGDKPLFMYIPFLSIHIANEIYPTQAPAENMKKVKDITNGKRRLVGAMVSALDDQVGRIVKALDEQGMLENTVIIFSSDNGAAPAGFLLNYGSNYPLRGGKGTLYEGGVRGVGLVWSPLIKKGCRVSQGLFHISDWMPTILSLTNIQSGTILGIDGVNIWRAISEEAESPRDEVLINIVEDKKEWALRSGDYKLVQSEAGMAYGGWYPPDDSETLSHIIGAKNVVNERQPPPEVPEGDPAPDEINIREIVARYITCPQPVDRTPKEVTCTGTQPPTDMCTQPCLFNVKDDPCEYNDLSATEPEKLQELLQKLEVHRKTTVPSGYKDHDPNADPKLQGGVWKPWVKPPAPQPPPATQPPAPTPFGVGAGPGLSSSIALVICGVLAAF